MTKPLYKTIGEHIIDDLLVAGLSLIIVAFGFNYFNLKNAWTQAFSTLSSAANVQGNFLEANLIISSINHTFPFSLFASDFSNFFVALIMGVVITLFGFALKVLTTPSREKFVEDLGKELYIPAVLGLFGIIALHVVTTILLQTQTEATTRINGGILVWQGFGSILLAGIISLVIGSVLLLVAKSRKWDKFIIVGRTMVNSSYVLLGYYLFIRILAFDVILQSPIGEFMKIFIVSGDISTTMIIFTVIMFWFGRELKRYGRYLRIKKKYEMKHQQNVQRLHIYADTSRQMANSYYPVTQQYKR